MNQEVLFPRVISVLVHDPCTRHVTFEAFMDTADCLGCVRLKVKDDHLIGKDDLCAWACIRLDRLQTGYRFIHLLDGTGLASPGVLLVRVSKTLS